MQKVKHGFPPIAITIIASILLALRLIVTYTLPLADKTEARYAEIARIMSETGEWVVLQIDYGIPFWAKPPLSTWMSAGSFTLIGVNEFAARLPSFLLSVLIIYILFKLVYKGKHKFFLIAIILMTTPQFLIHAGAVSTDVTFTVCLLLAMLSFWRSVMTGETLWAYFFFVAMGFGLLAKGPLIVVLVGPPLLLWCLLEKGRLRRVLNTFPWISGLFITILISFPWYYMAEQRSPGFIDYFVIGEHFMRFLESGWNGDLYGKPKSQPIGMIWLFLIVFAFPWVQLAFYFLIRNRKQLLKDSWLSFLVLWLVWTPIFFTLSSNVLHTYILPVIPAVALVVLHYWDDFPYKRISIGVALFIPMMAFVGYFFTYYTGSLDEYLNTDKYLLEATSENDSPIYYLGDKTYSGQFYAQGSVKAIEDLSVLKESQSGCYLILKHRDIKSLSDDFLNKTTLIESNQHRTMFYFLPSVSKKTGHLSQNE